MVRLLIFVLLAIASAALGGWEQTFSEEFNGQTSLDNSKWITGYHFSPAVINEELQFYSPGGFTFGADHLRIVGEKISVNGFDYQSGVITTKDRWSQTFGYFEMRARWTTGRGLWPAFWLLPQNVKDHGIAEIDILETLLQNPETAYMTVHCDSNQHFHDAYTGNELADQDWHTYSLQWTPDITIWYIDGIQRFNQSGCSYNMPMYILANMAIGGGWPGPPNATTPFPAYMDVDYIRAYRQVPSGGVSLPGPGEGIAFSNPTLATPARFTFSNPTLSQQTVEPGDSLSIGLTVTAGPLGLSDGNVQMFLSEWSNTKDAVMNKQLGGVTLTDGQSRVLTWDLVVPNVTDGYYRVSVGIFAADWTNLLWSGNVHVIGVNEIVGGREMPVVPTDAPSSSQAPSAAGPQGLSSSSTRFVSSTLGAFVFMFCML